VFQSKTPSTPIVRADRLQYGLDQVTQHLFGADRLNRIFKSRSKRRRQLLDRMYSSLKASEPIPLQPVDRVKDISIADFRRDYQKTGIPVVLEGAALDWPCCKTWNLSFLSEKHGDDLVLGDRGFSTLKASLSRIESGFNDYLRFYALLQRHPERLCDLDLKWLRARRNSRSINIDQGFQTFIGNSTSPTTHLHNANDANLFIQVTGEKHWIFYPSAFTSAIDPPATRSEYRTHRKDEPFFDPFAPNYDAFPVFKHVPGWETVLKPGDVLWNPPYVWHTVRNLSDPTIGVGYRWVCPTDCFRREPLYAFLDCLATNPPIWKSLRQSDRGFLLVLMQHFEGHRLPRYEEFNSQLNASYKEYRAMKKKLLK